MLSKPVYVIVMKSGKIAMNEYERPHVYLQKKLAEEQVKEKPDLTIMEYRPAQESPPRWMKPQNKMRQRCKHSRWNKIKQPYCPDCGREKK